MFYFPVTRASTATGLKRLVNVEHVLSSTFSHQLLLVKVMECGIGERVNE